MAYGPPFNEPKAREGREDDDGLTEAENRDGEQTMEHGSSLNLTVVVALGLWRFVEAKACSKTR